VLSEELDIDRSEAKTMRDDEGEKKGFLWRLPKLQTHDWGKMGPAFGYGIGCGVGLGAGIVGGMISSTFGGLEKLVVRSFFQLEF